MRRGREHRGPGLGFATNRLWPADFRIMPGSSHPRPRHKWPSPAAHPPEPGTGSSFLLRHGARRLHLASARQLDPKAPVEDPPILEPAAASFSMSAHQDDSLPSAQTPASQSPIGARRLEWGEERAPGAWQPLDVRPRAQGAGFDWGSRPLRFVASCDVGREVAWLRDGQGEPVPLRLAQLGALSLQAPAVRSEGRFQARALRRPWARLERVVALAADRFEWDEIEEWSTLLASQGFRLLIVPDSASSLEPTSGNWKLSATACEARARTSEEALRLERQAIRAALARPQPRAGTAFPTLDEPEAPVFVSGSLVLRRGAFGPGQAVVGVCSPHPLLPPIILPEWQPTPAVSGSPHSAQGLAEAEQASIPRQVWRTIYALGSGQRTPVWRCDEPACPLACWFVRLHAASSSPGSEGSTGAADSPLSGVVRVEVRRELWAAQEDPQRFAEGLSSLLLDARTHGQGRLWPATRAWQHLRALLTPHPALEARFGRLCGL